MLVLIFAEVTPISYAAANPEAFATGVATLVNACTRVLQPLVAVFSAVAGVFVRALGGEPATRPVVTGEEVMTIVNLETERGVLEEEEKALIHSIFEFSDTIVREIMRPRIDVIAVADTGTVAEAVALIASHRISRLPVYQGSIDHTVGLVHAKDLLPYQIRRALTAPVRLAMRPATFVPETKRVSELLRELREAKQTLAIVLDEYGGTAGLVTVEDLLEEIVGEIYDEYDVEQALLERVDDRTVIVDGKFLMDELDDLFDHKFPDGEYDTVGGFIYHHFGDVPARGEQCTVDGYLFIVERLDGHRIAKVRVIAPAEEQAP